MNMKVTIAGVEWKNPVTVASGTFGSGAEFAEFADLNKLGAVTTKGRGSIRGYDERNRTAESGDRSVLREGYSFFKAV